MNIIIPTRQDTSGGRYYEHEGKMIPSVTTVLNSVSKGIGYAKWLGNYSSYEAAMEYAQKRAERGERVHINCEALINGLMVDTENMPIDEALCIMAFVEWVNAVKPTFIASELTMFHPDMLIAGTADIVCTIRDQLFLIDIKTTKSLWDIHGVQLTGYGRLYEKIYGKKPELSALKLSVGRGQKPKYEIKRYAYQDDALLNAIQLFDWLNPNRPKPRTPVVIPPIIQLDKEFINVKESE